MEYYSTKHSNSTNILPNILALTLSGCTIDDEPAATPTPKTMVEKVIKTTPDGMAFYTTQDTPDGCFRCWRTPWKITRPQVDTLISEPVGKTKAFRD